MSKLKSKLMVIQCAALTASLAALFVGTYAWYTANRQTTVSVTNIGTEQGIECTVYQFNGNTGINNKAGYRYSDMTTTGVTVGWDSGSYYFAATTDTSFTIPKLSPKYRATYAFKVTNGFVATSNIELALTSFLSEASTSYYSYDATLAAKTANSSNDDQGIRLAEAINIYSTVLDFSSSTFATDVSAFIKTEAPTDLFAFDYSSVYQDASGKKNTAVFTQETDGSFSSQISLSSAACLNKTLVFFLTIEFSNDSSTYYHGTPDTYANIKTAKANTDTTTATNTGSVFYYKDTTGNSNAYDSTKANVGFTLTELYLMRTYN